MMVVITDEMVERAAKALEKERKSLYEWTDEQFEIWWNHDWEFVTRVRNWGFFRGTDKERCLWEARLTLSHALNITLPNKQLCAICDDVHDNDVLTDICKDCEARINIEGSP